MKVGVTGATGFVGRSLVSKLSSDNYQVVPMVRGISHLKNEYLIGDVSLPLKGNFPDLDAVIHLAGLAHIHERDERDAKRRFFSANVDGTRRVLDASIAAGISHFIFVSSVKVHGEKTATGSPFVETDICDPEDIYGESKQEAERLVLNKCHEAGVAYTIIRPPLIYGRGVGANFKKLAALARAPFPVPLGSINNRRSLIYVENLADIISAALNSDAALDQIFLVSDGQDVSTSELLSQLAKAQNRSIRLLPAKPLRLGLGLAGMTEVRDRLFSNLQVDSSHVRQSLGWIPRFDLATGLADSFGPRD
jgi:nucleoside-diphosphate-sugar epimerase